MTPRAQVALVVAVAILASVTGLGNGFAYDDIPIIVENPMVGALHAPWEYLSDSYWGPSRGNSLYRPLTVALFSLQWAVGGGSPFPFHLMNILLYAATAVAVLWLLRSLLPLRLLNPEVPERLEQIVNHALERDPARRYATAGDMGLDLERFIYEKGYGPTNLTLAAHLKNLFTDPVEALAK